jgi:hypothetical protein
MDTRSPVNVMGKTTNDGIRNAVNMKSDDESSKH